MTDFLPKMNQIVNLVTVEWPIARPFRALKRIMGGRGYNIDIAIRSCLVKMYSTIFISGEWFSPHPKCSKFWIIGVFYINLWQCTVSSSVPLNLRNVLTALIDTLLGIPNCNHFLNHNFNLQRPKLPQWKEGLRGFRGLFHSNVQ